MAILMPFLGPASPIFSGMVHHRFASRIFLESFTVSLNHTQK